MLKGIVIGAVLLGATIPSLGKVSAEGTCELAGVNDGGGYIACSDFEGPARVTGISQVPEFTGHRTVLNILVNDETPIQAEVWFDPSGGVFAVLLYEGPEMFAFAITNKGNYQRSEADLSYSGGTLDYSAPCDAYTSAHWCE